jgi:hypothetical protein
MKLSWPGLNEKGSVIIELSPDAFSLAKNAIEVRGESFIPKQELHVTVVASKSGMILQDKIKRDQTINKALKKTFERIDWSFKQTGPVHILSRPAGEGFEKSIIMLIGMPGLAAFYDQLKNIGLIDADTPIPPPHVTLYTQNCPAGISVPDETTLNTLSIETLSLDTFNKQLT